MYQFVLNVRKKSWYCLPVYFLLVVAPFQIGTFIFMPNSYMSGVRIDYLALSVYATDFLVLFIVIISNWKLRNNISLFVFLLYSATNAGISHNPLLSFYRWLKIDLLLILLLSINRSRVHPYWVTIAFIISASSELALCLSQLLYQSSLQGFWYYLGERYYQISTPGIAKASFGGVEFVRPYGTFSHPNALGGYFVLLFAWTYLSTHLQSVGWWKNLLLFLSGSLVIISFSKNALLALCLTLIIPIVWNYKKCYLCTLSRVLLVAFFIGFVLYIHSDPLSFDKRIFLMKSSLRIISQHPLLGVGLGNYLYYQNNIVNHYYSFFLEPVHNVFLLLISEIGLIGSILLIWIGFLKVKNTIHLASYQWVLILVLTGLFDHYWLTQQQNLLLIPILFGLSQKDTL